MTRVARILAGSGRLSLPECLVLDHRVEDGQQLVPTRHQGHLLGLAGLHDPPVERQDDRIAAGGTQRPYGERRPHRCPPAPDGLAAAQRPASATRRSAPTKAAIWAWESRPNSGRSASSESEMVGPIPGTLRNRLACARSSAGSPAPGGAGRHPGPPSPSPARPDAPGCGRARGGRGSPPAAPAQLCAAPPTGAAAPPAPPIPALVQGSGGRRSDEDSPQLGGTIRSDRDAG